MGNSTFLKEAVTTLFTLHAVLRAGCQIISQEVAKAAIICPILFYASQFTIINPTI